MTCDSNMATPWKKHKEINFPFCNHGVLYRPLYSYFFETANQYIFDGKKYSTYPPKDSALLNADFISCKDEITNDNLDLLYIRSWLKLRRGQIWTQLWSELWRTSNYMYQMSHDFPCTKKETNDLSLASTFNVRQGRNKISKWIRYAFDSFQRQGQTWQ